MRRTKEDGQQTKTKHVILKKKFEREEESFETPTSRFLTRATKGLRSKKNSYSPIYIILRLKIVFFLDSTTANNQGGSYGQSRL